MANSTNSTGTMSIDDQELIAIVKTFREVDQDLLGLGVCIIPSKPLLSSNNFRL